MAINVTMPLNGPFTIQDIIGSIDAIVFDFTLTGGNASGFTGAGLYKGLPATYAVGGSGFAQSPGGDIVAGIVSTIQFTTGGQSISFTNVNINMAAFAPAIAAEDSGADPTAVEDFLLPLGWYMTLGNNADLAPLGSRVGDNVPFDLTGNDIIHARGGNDNIYAGAGDDRVWGDAGSDILTLGLGDDRAWGGRGNDEINGHSGNDRIDPGRGRDICIGSIGNDVFIFGNNYGVDRIKDFNSNNDLEDINLRKVSAITSFADLRNNHMKQVGADVVIDDHAGTKIIIENTPLAEMNRGDFLF